MDFSKLKLSAMSPGTYTVKAIFDGDDTYKPTETTFILVVSEHASGSQFYPENPAYGDKTYPVLNFTEPEVKVTENSSGKYKIQLPNNPNNVDLTYSVSGGTLDIQAMTLEAEVGTYTISVTSPESSRYYSVTASYTLTIEEYNEETDPEVDPDTPSPTQPEEDEEEDKSIMYFQRQLVYQQTNDSMVYDLQQPSLKEGVPSYILNSCWYTIDNNQTHIPIQPTIMIQGEGQHIIYLHFPGNSTYEAHNIAYTLGIYSEIDLNTQSIGLRFTNSFYNYEDLESGTAELYFIMSADYTQLNVSKFKLTVTESGTSSQVQGCTVNVPNKKVTLNNLTIGKTYNVQLRYEGDDKYKPAVASCTVNVIGDIISGYANEYLTIESLEDGNTIGFKSYESKVTKTIEYSTDQTNWTSVTSSKSGTTIATLNTGDKIYLRGNNSTYCDQYNWTYFTSTKTFNVYGNIMSLINSSTFKTLTSLQSVNTFESLFTSSKVVDVSNLILPATTLVDYCYYRMFNGCSILTAAPNLPATTLADSCYGQMFQDCSSLTTAPELPATTLANWCYSRMFHGCTSLEYTPNLPATTLANDCYRNMFSECRSLAMAHALPATTLAIECYKEMFYHCTSLTTPPQLPATTLADSCYGSMFSLCTSLEYAPNLPATTLAEECYRYMFNGCTSLVNAPNLPATTLAEECYRYMFNGCTSLVNAPELPATTLTQGCYSSMFAQCSGLTTAPELPATTLATYCYGSMFIGCTSLTAAPELPATTLADSCYSSMFQGCTSLTVAPELPATTLSYACYIGMFYSCTSLTTAPELPATILVDQCYDQMFRDCSNLNYVKMLATDISSSLCLHIWLNGVSSTGTFIKHPNANIPRGEDGIPEGWTVQTATS